VVTVKANDDRMKAKKRFRLEEREGESIKTCNRNL